MKAEDLDLWDQETLQAITTAADECCANVGNSNWSRAFDDLSFAAQTLDAMITRLNIYKATHPDAQP